MVVAQKVDQSRQTKCCRGKCFCVNEFSVNLNDSSKYLFTG